MSLSQLNIQNSFLESLPQDIAKWGKTPRQVYKACYSLVAPDNIENPKLIAYSADVAHLLGIDVSCCTSSNFLEIFSGKKIYANTSPYAMCYGGHQFGNWAGQLGDGRVINLFEVLHQKKRWAVQLKGAGQTPYSRHADGLAVLRSSIREFLCSEAMHYLGVPTTRALSLIASPQKIKRDMFYDGNPRLEQSAIVCRVAPTFIRFGSFEIFTARNDIETLRKIADYTIKYFFPEIDPISTRRYVDWFKKVYQNTIQLIVHWQRIGFVHGVMNTDNMSILGLTMDYGPYGWLDIYQKDWTPNFTDYTTRRYTYKQQPYIAYWNLARLADSIYPLVQDKDALQTILNGFETDYESEFLKMMKRKLGWEQFCAEDSLLIQSLDQWLEKIPTDMTMFFRILATIESSLSEVDIAKKLAPCFYDESYLNHTEMWIDWIKKYCLRTAKENMNTLQKAERMNAINPKYILRNHLVHQAIEDAEQGNYDQIYALQKLIQQPYDEQAQNTHYFQKQPAWAREKIGCSMLSCSS